MANAKKASISEAFSLSETQTPEEMVVFRND
jgi:hypothetical protein